MDFVDFLDLALDRAYLDDGAVQIFLSHATSDHDLVGQIKVAIGDTADVYCTEDDVKAGVNVHDKIRAQIRKSDLVVVLLTGLAADRIYLHQEIGAAKQAGKLVIPLVGNDVPHSSLGMLEGTEYIRIDPDSGDWLPRLRSRVEGIQRMEQSLAAALGVVLVIAGLLVLSRQ